MNHLFMENWVILLPLIGLSIFTLALVIERALFFINRKTLDEGRFLLGLEALRRGDFQEADRGFSLENDVVCQVYRKGTSLISPGEKPLTATLQAFAQDRVNQMEMRLELLPQFANIATLIGLFGTVLGMIFSFSLLKTAGAANPEALAGGIAQALTATAGGLFAAIPALIGHSFFLHLVDLRTRRMETLIQAFSAWDQKPILKEPL